MGQRGRDGGEQFNKEVLLPCSASLREGLAGYLGNLLLLPVIFLEPVFVITWQVSSRVTDCGCLRHPLVYRPFSRHRFFLFPDSALSPCTNSNEHLNPLFTRLGLRSHDTSHIYLATIPTRIRVIRDDYNKL